MGIPAAPWHRPKARYVGNGVYVTTIYGSHLIAALIHWLFVALRRRWKRPAQNQDRTREVVDPASEPVVGGDGRTPIIDAVTGQQIHTPPGAK